MILMLSRKKYVEKKFKMLKICRGEMYEIRKHELAQRRFMWKNKQVLRR